MSSYQSIAENGLKACQGPEKVLKCSDSLAGLPAADGLMLIDSNWGIATMMLFSLDPAVISEEDGKKLNPELDLFNPKNGFDPAGSNFSDAFIRKFQIAEGKRNDQLIQTALDRLEQDPNSFGLCAECGDAIAARRLALMPYVELCVECQQARDRPSGPSGRRHLRDFR